eukprot:2276551-Rhodomonas_salina.5
MALPGATRGGSTDHEHSQRRSGMLLRPPYAMSDTDVVCTDLAYGPVLCAVLSWRTVQCDVGLSGLSGTERAYGTQAKRAMMRMWKEFWGTQRGKRDTVLKTLDPRRAGTDGTRSGRAGAAALPWAAEQERVRGVERVRGGVQALGRRALRAAEKRAPATTPGRSKASRCSAR